jgi:hypothetical protein
MVSTAIRDDPVTDNRQKVGKIFRGAGGVTMARTVREASLATRSARLRLAINTKPYWRIIEQGLHLGYRRRAIGGTWIVRRRDDGLYHEAKLGLADDLQDANGDAILNFSQAQNAARAWCLQQQRLASGLDTPASDGPYTVARAMTDYMDDYRRRGGKAADSITSVVRQNILVPLGDLEVGVRARSSSTKRKPVLWR